MIVADTNVMVYLLVRGQRANEADAVYKKDSHWVAPSLWRSEFRNVLTLFVRQKSMGLDEALEAMEKAEQLMMGQDFEVTTSSVLRLAASSGCSAYDCEFAALAQALGVRLVTVDRMLLAKFKPLAISMSDFCS